MRDEHDGAGIVGEKRFEPRHRLDVEMVGRLVEQQQIWLRHERACEQHAPAPAARQRRHDGIGRQAERDDHHLDADVDVPALDVRVGVESLGDDVEHRAIGRERHVLHQPRDAKRRLPPDSAGVGVTSPPMICSSVDLPVPLRPMTQTRSPASICRLASSRSGRWP